MALNDTSLEEIKNQQEIFYRKLRNSIKYKIYLDLKKKGFYITTGLKYGADFLLYNGKF